MAVAVVVESLVQSQASSQSVCLNLSQQCQVGGRPLLGGPEEASPKRKRQETLDSRVKQHLQALRVRSSLIRFPWNPAWIPEPAYQAGGKAEYGAKYGVRLLGHGTMFCACLPHIDKAHLAHCARTPIHGPSPLQPAAVFRLRWTNHRQVPTVGLAHPRIEEPAPLQLAK